MLSPNVSPERFASELGLEHIPDGWIQFDCSELFPYIKANSATGKATLQLARIRWMALQNLLNNRNRIDKGIAEFDAAREQSLSDNFNENDSRFQVAVHLYGFTERALSLDCLDYDSAVRQGHANTAAGIHSLDVPVGTKRNLLQVADQLSMYYRLESDCHFQELLDK